MKMRLKLVSFFRPFLGLLLAIALTTASPLANPTPGLVRAFELSSPLGDSIANTPLLDGVAKNKTTNQKSKLKPIKHTELSEHFSVIPESLKVAFPPEESNEPNGKSNPIVKFCEHLMGVKTPKKPKSARAILASLDHPSPLPTPTFYIQANVYIGTAASLQDTPSKASKKSKEVSNGLNEQPSSNPIVKLWKKLVGEKEKEEVNIEVDGTKVFFFSKLSTNFSRITTRFLMIKRRGKV